MPLFSLVLLVIGTLQNWKTQMPTSEIGQLQIYCSIICLVLQT